MSTEKQAKQSPRRVFIDVVGPSHFRQTYELVVHEGEDPNGMLQAIDDGYATEVGGREYDDLDSWVDSFEFNLDEEPTVTQLSQAMSRHDGVPATGVVATCSPDNPFASAYEEASRNEQGLPPAGGGANSTWMLGLFQDGPCKRCGQGAGGHILEKATKAGGLPNIKCLG